MDGLSAATTVISVLQTAWQVISYVKAVKGAGEEREKLLVELIGARGVLATLNDLTEDVRNDEWSQALQSLDGPNGPLCAFKALLEEIIDDMGIKGTLKKAPQTQQPAPVVPKSRSSKLMRFFQKNSSSSSSRIAPTNRSEAFERPPNDYHRTVARVDAAMKDLKWPFTLPHLQELVNKLERIKTHFLVALTSDNVRLSKLIREELQIVQGEIFVIKDNTTAIREHQEGSKEWTLEQRRMFQSISTLDNLTSRVSPHEVERLKRSASWLLSHSTFRQWGDGGGALLLSGMAGSGKTSICKVVENFLQSSGSSSEVFVVAIYFSINRPENQSLQTVLAFIVKHMLRVYPQFQKYYNKLMLTGEGPLEVVDSLRIIHRARQDFQYFYIVLDALDECDHELAQEVVGRLTSLRTPLRIFATSRPSSLANHFSYEITISQELVSDKIKSYVQEALAKRLPIAIARSLKKDTAEFDRVVDTIVAQSEGMFLYARLVVDQLCKAHSREIVMEILKPSPQKINDICAYCLQRLSEQEESDARLGKRVLKKLLSADQPMSAEELLDAIADDAGWEAGDRSRIEERLKRCVECSMNLVARAEDGTVGFAHIAVKQYLNSHGIPD